MLLSRQRGGGHCPPSVRYDRYAVRSSRITESNKLSRTCHHRGQLLNLRAMGSIAWRRAWRR